MKRVDLVSVSPAVVFARPRPEQIWLGSTQTAALEFLFEAHAERRMALLTGPRGCGKSSVLAAFLQRAPYSVFFRIRDRWESGAALLAALVESTGQSPAAEAAAAADHEPLIRAYLERQRDLGQTTILAVDDAEYLPVDAWQVLSRLAAINLDGYRPHLVIVGRPTTQQSLQAAADWGSTRLLVHRMPTASVDDVAAYVANRLEGVGLTPKVFAPAATALIAGLARGSFAQVNLLGQASMLLAQRRRESSVSEDLVVEAHASLGRMHDAELAERKEPARVAGAVIRLGARDPSRLRMRR